MKTTARLGKFKLAAALGVSRTTLDGYLAKPGAPSADRKRTYDVAEARAFLVAEGKRGVAGSEQSDLRSRKLRLEVEEIERKLAIERGDLIRASDLAPTIGAFNAQLMADLAQMEIELPPRCHGKDRIQIAALVAEWRDRILRNLKAGQWALGRGKGGK